MNAENFEVCKPSQAELLKPHGLHGQQSVQSAQATVPQEGVGAMHEASLLHHLQALVPEPHSTPCEKVDTGLHAKGMQILAHVK